MLSFKKLSAGGRLCTLQENPHVWVSMIKIRQPDGTVPCECRGYVQKRFSRQTGGCHTARSLQKRQQVGRRSRSPCRISTGSRWNTCTSSQRPLRTEDPCGCPPSGGSSTSSLRPERNILFTVAFCLVPQKPLTLDLIASSVASLHES